MNDPEHHGCAICGEQPTDHRHWFLVIESAGEDKLWILEWNRSLASQAGVHPACSPSHVQQLVVHWMATGSVGHPFARPTSWAKSNRQWYELPGSDFTLDTAGVRTVGELMVQRESLHRVLRENPACLRAVLEALGYAMESRNPARRISAFAETALGM